MKSITSYLLKFAIVAFILTIAFKFSLSYLLEVELFTLIWVLAVSYGLAMFGSGWYFGSKEASYLPLYDIGFRFHLVTYIVYTGIFFLWFILGLNTAQERVDSVYTTALLWGLFLAIHFAFYLVTRKDTIKNLNKEDLFE